MKAIIILAALLCVSIIFAVFFKLRLNQAMAQLDELDNAQAQIAKLKKDCNSAKSARDKVMCDYNSLSSRIVELEEDYPDKPVRNIGMRFMNEIREYIRIDKEKGKMYLKVVKE